MPCHRAQCLTVDPNTVYRHVIFMHVKHRELEALCICTDGVCRPGVLASSAVFTKSAQSN